MLETLLAGYVLRLVAYSRLLMVLFGATVLALAAAALLAAGTPAAGANDGGSAEDRPSANARGSVLMPFALFAGASFSTLVALSSPGTVPSNHMVEWIETCLVVLAFLACTRPAMTRGVAIFTCVFVLWASAQDVRAARGLLLTRAARAARRRRW